MTRSDWKLLRYPTIMSGAVYRWQFDTSEVNASRDGVSLRGHFPIMRDIATLLLVLRAAEKAHVALRKDESWDPAEIDGWAVLNPPPIGQDHREPTPRHPELFP